MARVLRIADCGRLAALDNMAVDEMLLEDGGAPVLRLYGWEPPAVSIGRFQRAADFADAAHGELVRRVTGGGAIHHDREITFALVCDIEVVPSDLGASYALVHGAIARALAGVGVEARRCGDGAASSRPSERWCFARASCHDLVTERGKIVGSAQRRTRARVLHHGSIVLEPPAATPGCGSVAEFVEPAAVERELTARVAVEIATALEMRSETWRPELDQGRIERVRAAVAERLELR